MTRNRRNILIGCGMLIIGGLALIALFLAFNITQQGQAIVQNSAPTTPTRMWVQVDATEVAGVVATRNAAIAELTRIAQVPTSKPVQPAATPTKMSTKASVATATKVLGTTLNVRALSAQSTQQQGGWTIEYFNGATDQMKGWKFADLVKDWDKYPNVDMPKYQFLAKDGVEYGMAESAYCQRAKTCDINVPAMHYRLVTGDYNIPGIDDCVIDKAGAGCGIMLINIGTVSAMFRESSVDYGFTVEGRYWNGDTMPTTVRALLSSTVYNMMVANTVNPGANCSIPTGCQKLRMTFAIMSGNQLLVKGTQVISR